MMEARKTRLIVNVNDLRKANEGLAAKLLERPLEPTGILALEAVLLEAVKNKKPEYFAGERGWGRARGGGEGRG
jgi:hypothetical protein